MAKNTVKKKNSFFHNKTALQKDNIKYVMSAIPKMEKSPLRKEQRVIMIVAFFVVIMDVFIFMKLDENGGKLLMLGILLISLGGVLRAKSKDNRMFTIIILGVFTLLRAVLMFFRTDSGCALLLETISSPLVFVLGLVVLGIGIVTYYIEKSQAGQNSIKLFDLGISSTMYLITGMVTCMTLFVR